MDFNFWEFLLHLDDHMSEFIVNYGLWTYTALFTIIFLETAVLVMAFLPGDSLLFAAGTMAAVTDLHIMGVMGTITLAAVLGNTAAYLLGFWLSRAAVAQRRQWVSEAQLAKAHEFFQRWGGWSVTICRFYPILRSLVPMAAGLSRMDFRNFTFFNVLGGLFWGAIIPLLGFFFGNIPIIRDNIVFIAVFVVVISLIPFLFAWFRRWKMGSVKVESPDKNFPSQEIRIPENLKSRD